MKRFLCALIVLVCCVFAAACAAAAQETSHAHVWEETAVWREPTCTEAGELLRICSVCSLSERIPIPARGHETGDWLHDDTTHWKECTACKERQETAPHHISDGVCTVCGAGFGSGSQEEGHTHSYVRLEEVPASCTEDGVVIMVCSVCGEKSAETIKAPGHETDGWEWDPTLHWHVCSRCGRTTDAQPHSFLGGNVCTVCGAERTSSGGIGHTHDWDEGTVTHAPTCTQTGTRVLTCRGCGITRTVEIPAAGHDFTGTYEKDGEQHWRLCANGCGAASTPVPHEWQLQEVISAPTCTQGGSARYACSECGLQRTESLPSGEHTPGDWEKDGTTHTRRCTICGLVLETEEHVWDTGTVTQAPTCTKEGVRVFACTVCGEAYDEPVPVLGHEMGNWTQDDEDTHSRECTRGCGKRETEAHCFDGNTCTVCAFTLQYTESLIFEEYKSASLEGYAVAGFNGEIPQEVVIPSRYEGAPVVAVKSGVFRDSSVRSIVLGSNIRELGMDCFLGCEQLTSITFGAAIGAEAIDAGAFRDCASLTISVSADNASLTCRDNCLIDENGTLILGGGPAIPDGVTAVGEGAFYGREGLSAIVLPESVRSVGADAFRESEIRSVTGEGVISLSDRAFSGCGALETASFAGAEQIGEQAFYDCTALQTVLLPSVGTIGRSAFGGCAVLASAVLGATLTQVSAEAFSDCYDLCIYFCGDEGMWQNVIFKGDAWYEPLYYDGQWEYRDGLPCPL